MIETINQVNREVSQELSIDEEIVKKINAYFWKEVKESIRSLDHTAIRIRGLGTLMVSRNKLQQKIKHIIKEIRYLKNDTKEFKKKNKEEVIEEKYLKLRQYLDRRNDIAVVYYEKVQDKKKRKNAK